MDWVGAGDQQRAGARDAGRFDGDAYGGRGLDVHAVVAAVDGEWDDARDAATHPVTPPSPAQ